MNKLDHLLTPFSASLASFSSRTITSKLMLPALIASTLSALSLPVMATLTALSTNAIIPATAGITLAQIKQGGNLQTLLVIKDQNEQVQAVNLSEHFSVLGDLITVYNTLGYEKINQLSQQPSLTTRTFSKQSLLSPAGDGEHHLGLGFNYAKHAAEVNDKPLPFLFAKVAKGTRDQDIVVKEKQLLDYEVEICARPLQNITKVETVKGPAFGLFLCGDFTDRAELMRGINVDNVQSGLGFSNAKSSEGFFPTGPYLVIGKDWQQLIADTNLSLTLNGEERQNDSGAQMLWKLPEALQKAVDHIKEQRGTDSTKVSSLLPKGGFTPQMSILTGTPEGIIYRPPSKTDKILYGTKYVITGSFFSTNAIDYVLEQYTNKLLEKKNFLQAGDQLQLKAKYLGDIKLKIVAQ